MKRGLGLRVATAAVGIPILLGTLVAGGLPWTGFLSFVVILGSLELSRLCRRLDLPVSPLILGFGGLMFLLSAYTSTMAGDSGTAWWPGIAWALLAVAWMREIRLGTEKGRVLNVAATLFGALYVGAGMSFLYLLRVEPGGLPLLWLVVMGTWLTDTGAYFVGLRLGKRRLAPSISPKKSVEGAIGGLVVGVGGIVLLNLAFFELPWILVLPVAVAVSIGGQLGDLAESLLKRQAGVKDSGALLPGHGGVLDRFDSLLFTAPITFYLSLLLR